MQTGSIYNFITGQSIAEENPDYVPLDPEKRSAEQAQQAQQELEQFQQELEQLQKELLNE
jgi:nitrate reductase assembly molybdenum cofactor insertion protein NarJ